MITVRLGLSWYCVLLCQWKVGKFKSNAEFARPFYAESILRSRGLSIWPQRTKNEWPSSFFALFYVSLAVSRGDERATMSNCALFLFFGWLFLRVTVPCIPSRFIASEADFPIFHRLKSIIYSKSRRTRVIQSILSHDNSDRMIGTFPFNTRITRRSSNND